MRKPKPKTVVTMPQAKIDGNPASGMHDLQRVITRVGQVTGALKAQGFNVTVSADVAVNFHVTVHDSKAKAGK